MAKASGRCKICNETVTVGGRDTPPGIAAEGVMESIQEYIFREHCDGDFQLVEGADEYDGVGDAWTYE